MPRQEEVGYRSMTRSISECHVGELDWTSGGGESEPPQLDLRSITARPFQLRKRP